MDLGPPKVPCPLSLKRSFAYLTQADAVLKMARRLDAAARPPPSPAGGPTGGGAGEGGSDVAPLSSALAAQHAAAAAAVAGLVAAEKVRGEGRAVTLLCDGRPLRLP